MTNHFNDNWLLIDNFNTWLLKVPGNNKEARCSLCKKTFSVSSMGISSLKSHQKSGTHQKNENAMNTSLNLNRYINQTSTCATAACESQESGLDKFVAKEDVQKAEILWAIKVVLSKYSLNSCQDLSKLLKIMFPDSEIAQLFSCGATKCGYLICHGIAPYFHDDLLKMINTTNCFSISFDECMNRVTQSEQMDLVVRFWHPEQEKIVSRYLGSEFLGHTTAIDLMEKFNHGMKDVGESKLLQISMDGPSVNWKFFDMYAEERKKTPDIPHLIDIGSCGLHIVHGSLQSGVKATGWGIKEILSSAWQIFHDSPARREDYTKVTGSSTFPLKFCPHRWVEDISVCERLINIWPHIIAYMKSFKGKPKSKIPNSKSFLALKSAVSDSLTIAKLQFFVSVAKPLHSFLEHFQTESPMVPFLAEEMFSIMYNLSTRFIAKKALEQVSDCMQLSRVIDEDNIVPAGKVDLGFAANCSVRDAMKGKRAKEIDVLQLKKGALDCLSCMMTKLIERNPGRYKLVRNLQSLDPRRMTDSSCNPEGKFKGVLRLLMESKRLTASECDDALHEYSTFLHDVRLTHSVAFANFKLNVDRVDEFFKQLLSEKKEFSKLWSVIKLILCLSHGQATIERGYSINKEMLVENLQPESLVAMRTVYDSIKSTYQGGATEVVVTKDMLNYVKSARQKYVQHLEDKKKEKTQTEKGRKRKAVKDEIKELEIEKKRMKEIIEALRNESSSLATEAEVKRSFLMLSKSNALRKKSLDKTEECKNIDTKLIELNEKLLSL